MSIEHLLGAYPADAHFAADVLNENEFQNGRAKVVALANFFYRKGAEGLRELDKKLDVRQVTIGDNNVPSKPLTTEENSMLSNNRATVMWGSLVTLFEEMLIDGEYRPTTLADRYNAGFLSSGWSGQLKFQFDTARVLTTDEKDNLSKMIKADKTFVSFLSEKGMRNLPAELSYTIISSGNLPTLNSFVLPEYKQRADLLLGVKSPVLASTTA